MQIEKSMPQFKTYVIRMSVFMGAYVAVNMAAIAGVFDSFNDIGKWAIAVVVGSLIAGHIWSVLSLIEQSDEYIRAMLVRQYLAASGLSMAIFTIWGFGESYADAPHAPGWFIYILFWACFAITAPLLRFLQK